MNRWFQAGIDLGELIVEDVAYDPVGVIGLKFNKPELQALFIQPASPEDDFSMVTVISEGKSTAAKPDERFGVLFDLGPRIRPGSRTAAMMQQFGISLLEGEPK